MQTPSLSTLTELTVVTGAVGTVIRYVYKLVRNAEASQDFVYDMATNHLPHLYDALSKLCARQGIDLGNPPPIQFVTKKKDKD